jgi:hypothetical protein
MNTITDHLGLVWTRSEDGTTLTCENGMTVIGVPEMTIEYLLSVAYLTE